MMAQQPAISVDLGRLQMFADMLKADTELGLQPGMIRANSEIQQGVRFGDAIAAGQIRAAREVLGAALAQAEANAAAQVSAATILTEAITRIIANYTEADQIAAQHLAAVEQTLSDAVRKAQRALEPPPPRPGGGVFE